VACSIACACGCVKRDFKFCTDSSRQQQVLCYGALELMIAYCRVSYNGMVWEGSSQKQTSSVRMNVLSRTGGLTAAKER
jgi:hypothetical protein